MIDWLILHTPFILAIEGKPKINTSRVIEAVIISLLGGVVAGYIAVQKLEVKVDILTQKVDKIYNDIYRPTY